MVLRSLVHLVVLVVWLFLVNGLLTVNINLLSGIKWS